MKVIAKNMGIGKMTELVKLSAEKQVPILTATTAGAGRIRERAKEQGLTIPNPIVFSKDEPWKGLSGVLVDDAEYILQCLLGVKVEAITVSTDDEEESVQNITAEYINKGPEQETLLLIKGQQMVMEMLLSTMPGALQEAWLDSFNEHNQSVVDLFRKPEDNPSEE